MNPASRGAITPTHVSDAGRGLRWWTDSFTWLFGDLARLGVWVGMSLSFVLITIPLHWFPVLGSVAAFLLTFVFCGGLMQAAQKTDRGQAPAFSDLFSGFGPRAGALVASGLLVLLANAAVLAVMFAVGVGAVIHSALGAASMSAWNAGALDSLDSLSIGWGSLVAFLLCLLLFIPISLAAWFTPALVMLRDAAPADALRMSLSGCMRNLGAITVYSLVGILLGIVSIATLLIGGIFLLPLCFLSTYAAYRDLFDTTFTVPPETIDRFT